MRIALHIFKKDALRLWWETVVTLGLLAALARMDSTRIDAVPSPMEALFNLLLPAAWCYLIALVIQEEPPVGDNQFWVTRPYHRPALLAAKALYVALFIHLPTILADAVILSARGFRPLDYLPQFVSKQVLLAAALTLPAAALAAVTRTVPQFLLAAIAIVGGAAFVTAPTTMFSRRWLAVDNARLGIVVFTLAVAGLLIVCLQYSRRRTGLARGLAVAALLTSGALLVYLPIERTQAWQCALSPAEINADSVSIQLTPGRYPRPRDQTVPSLDLVQIPIGVTGLKDADEVLWYPLAFEIAGARGGRWRMPSAARRAGRVGDMVFPTLATQTGNFGWLMLSLDPLIYAKTKDDRITATGKTVATVLRKQARAQLRIGQPSVAVHGVGRCSAILGADSPRQMVGLEMINVTCESPGEIPFRINVRVLGADGSSLAERYLGDSAPYLSYPTEALLSPINRSQTSIEVGFENRARAGYRPLVPRRSLPGATVEIEAVRRTGCVVVDYQLRDLALGEYRVK